MDKKTIKEAEIKRYNPTLLAKVKSGQITLQEAYNIMMSDIMGVKEMKGRGSKSNKTSFKTEFDIVQKRYKPSLEEWIERLKDQFPYTYTKHIKD